MGRNPQYYNFDEIGGDCTNFASQCIYAGCGVMNYTPVTGWFYINANDRSASWTSVKYLHIFLTTNKGAGPFAEEVPRNKIMPGDIIQLANTNMDYYHTLVVLDKTKNEIFIAAHSLDSLWRPLSSYEYYKARYIHIIAARPPSPGLAK